MRGGFYAALSGHVNARFEGKFSPRLVGPGWVRVHCAPDGLVAASRNTTDSCEKAPLAAVGATGTFAFHRHPLVGCFARAALERQDESAREYQ